VVAAGNVNQEVTNTLPAACPDAITVGASAKNGEKASFSNYGNPVDIYAPGVDMYTTTLSGGYTVKDGTSFATPVVAGLVARGLGQNPSMDSNQILDYIRSYSGLTANFPV